MSTVNVKLAVIIVSYGNADDVDRCLKSLARSDLDHFEIFICENGGEASLRDLARYARRVGQNVTSNVRRVRRSRQTAETTGISCEMPISGPRECGAGRTGDGKSRLRRRRQRVA